MASDKESHDPKVYAELDDFLDFNPPRTYKKTPAGGSKSDIEQEGSKLRKKQKVECNAKDDDQDHESGNVSQGSEQFHIAEDGEPAQAALEVPESFRGQFVTNNGRDLVLVMEKHLTKSDLCPLQRRLIVSNRCKDFLNDMEKKELSSTEKGKRHLKKINTIFFDTKGNQINVPICKHRRGYALCDPWLEMALNDDNKLAVGTYIELWAFRGGDNDICLAIVKKESVSCFGGGSTLLSSHWRL